LQGEEKAMDKSSTKQSQNGTAPQATRSTEVQPSAQRPVRSAAERLRLVEEYDSYPTGSPERGALLRREGIFTSQISKWRKLRTKGALAALTPKVSGPKPDPLLAEIDALRKENTRLQARLAQAETVIDIQKKVAALLGIDPLSPQSEDR
jgi:transposase